VIRRNGEWLMYYIYAHLDASAANDLGALHATADAYNTGLVLASTALATRCIQVFLNYY
jgi:hypothetical protein